MFENILGKPKEKRTQLHFRDDGAFEFRRLEIEDTFLVEKKNDEIIKGWKHFYRNQFPFAGYKGIKPDQVTLSYDRDIILDPYNLVDEKDKPDKHRKIKWFKESMFICGFSVRLRGVFSVSQSRREGWGL